MWPAGITKDSSAACPFFQTSWRDREKRRGVDVVAQHFDGGPGRHVDDNEGTVIIGELGGVAGSRLQTPDKAWSCIRESVDGIEL